MGNAPIITLTTDFGYKDPFVGIMKGVILGINPSINIVDITHDIAPGNIMQAAFAIETSFAYFPYKTIHLVVVDPGVGTMRRPIIVSTARHYLVGPDNGIFSRIYSIAESIDVFHVTAEHYFLSPRSKTFHGRDIFAPVAAWLSKGVDIMNFGEPISDYINLPIPLPSFPAKNIIEGEIIYIDRFGNLTTNIHSQKIEDLLENNKGKKMRVLVKGMEAPFRNFYADANDNGIYSLINSFNYIELFVKNGNASLEFGLKVGDKVGVIFN